MESLIRLFNSRFKAFANISLLLLLKREESLYSSSCCLGTVYLIFCYTLKINHVFFLIYCHQYTCIISTEYYTEKLSSNTCYHYQPADKTTSEVINFLNNNFKISISMTVLQTRQSSSDSDTTKYTRFPEKN